MEEEKNCCFYFIIYRPPSRGLPDEESSFTLCLNHIQDVINKHQDAEIQIHGDFNFPFIDWDTYELKRSGRPRSEQNSANKLLSLINKTFLYK